MCAQRKKESKGRVGNEGREEGRVAGQEGMGREGGEREGRKAIDL